MPTNILTTLKHLNIKIMKIERTKLLVILVFVLLALNITTLATIWIGKAQLNMKHDMQFGAKKLIIEKLHFDESQIEEFNVLVEEHQQQMKDLKEQIFENKEAFYSQLKNDAPDTALAYQSIANITSFEEKSEHITFEHFRKVRALCDSDQKQKFDIVIGEILRTMMGPQNDMHRGPMGPPPGGPARN